jgi:hypothetical protein
VVKLDGGLLSSDGGVLALREVETRRRVADRLAACVVDPRAPEQITHNLADIIRFRRLMMGAGYADAIDADRRRGGTRRSPLPDFLIGAHPAVAGYDLLTRDAARYRTYSPKLTLIAPGRAGGVTQGRFFFRSLRSGGNRS